MRLLFEMNNCGDIGEGTAFVRHSARSIVIRRGKVAMV